MYTRRSLQPSMLLVIQAALALGWAATVAAADQKFPATGQKTCYDSAGSVIACQGTGQDGDIRAGATLKYRDNGDGTITDQNTGLTWEKKSDDGSIHDMDNTYSWEDAFRYVTTLNFTCKNDVDVECRTNADCAGVGGTCGLAGKRDWRVPNVRELQSIIHYEKFNPAVPPKFNTNCAGATPLTGSCTSMSNYWTSTSYVRDPRGVWVVDFSDGRVDLWGKRFIVMHPQLTEDSEPPEFPEAHVRAVRGGL